MTTLITDDEAARREPIEISFAGQSAPMIGLGFINGVLKVLTLGLYSFWAKTEVRRRIWSGTRLNGEPVTYTGTGKELFLGFLIVFGAVVLPVLLGGVAVSLIFAGSKQALVTYQTLLYVAFFMLIGNAIYRAQRYRLSRTEWRGIRGGLAGSPGRYGWAYFWTLAVPMGVIALAAAVSAYVFAPSVGGVIMLLGLMAVLWVLPWRANHLQGLMTRDMRFGDRPLSYDGTSRPLYKRYLFAWLGNSLIFAGAVATTAAYVMQSDLYFKYLQKVPPTVSEVLPLIGIWVTSLIASAVLTSWYRASQMNHFAVHTHFESATFRGEATGRSLMWLVLSNWLLSIIGIVTGVAIGGALLYALAPAAPPDQMSAEGNGLKALVLVMPPIIILTTLTATFAQYRAARYFLSRLKLDGDVDLGVVLQSQNRVPARGEGLAQVFDIDAF